MPTLWLFLSRLGLGIVFLDLTCTDFKFIFLTLLLVTPAQEWVVQESLRAWSTVLR